MLTVTSWSDVRISTPALAFISAVALNEVVIMSMLHFAIWSTEIVMARTFSLPAPYAPFDMVHMEPYGPYCSMQCVLRYGAYYAPYLQEDGLKLSFCNARMVLCIISEAARANLLHWGHYITCSW